MADAQAGWYDDGSGRMRWWDGQQWTDQYQTPTPPQAGIEGFIARAQADAVAGAQPRPAQNGWNYVVLQVVLKEKFFGTGSGNLTELENVINRQAALGFRGGLHGRCSFSAGFMAWTVQGSVSRSDTTTSTGNRPRSQSATSSSQGRSLAQCATSSSAGPPAARCSPAG